MRMESTSFNIHFSKIPTEDMAGSTRLWSSILGIQQLINFKKKSQKDKNKQKHQLLS